MGPVNWRLGWGRFSAGVCVCVCERGTDSGMYDHMPRSHVLDHDQSGKNRKNRSVGHG